MKIVKSVILVLLLIGASLFVGKYYDYLFARTIKGELVGVERLQIDVALMTSQNQASQGVPSQLYSFAVAIKTEDGEIHTASSEDRQWAVAEKGMCVEAKYYPYPPWDLDKDGTYHNARLLRMGACPLK
jgi:hypothetical protein